MNADVLVVGGGIAGLTSAVGLAREGRRVIVLEKASHPGGRASSWVDSTTQDVIDIGPHIFLTEYPNFFALLSLLGTRQDVVWQEDGLFVHLVDGERSHPYRFAKLPTPLHFVPSLLTDKSTSLRDTLSTLPVTAYALGITDEALRSLDDENALPFLRRMGVSEGHVARYWAFASMAIMNVPIHLCSAGALLRLHRRLMGNNHFQVGFASAGLGSLYVPGATRFIEERGGEVRTSVAVQRLVTENGRVVGVELEDGQVLRAGHVIAAVPPHALRPLLDPSWLGSGPFEKLVRFQPCPYVSVYLWFDRKLTPLQFWSRSFKPNDLNLDFYDLTNINPQWRGRPSLTASNIIYSHRTHGLSDAQIVAATVRELAEFLPEAGKATLRHAVVNRIPMAIHCPYPGTEAARPSTVTNRAGLTLAGDWVDTGLPSSMESAALSGWRAVEAVLKEDGVSRSFGVAHQEMLGLAGVISRGTDWLPNRLVRRVATRIMGGRQPA
jgi:squalene-associated FAD-dependent desaturase